MTRANWFGVAAALAHLLLVVYSVESFLQTDPEEAQAGLIFAPLIMIDLPLTLLDCFRQIFDPVKALLAQHGYAVSRSVLSIMIVHGVLGTGWAFYLPRFFLPRRLGGRLHD